MGGVFVAELRLRYHHWQAEIQMANGKSTRYTRDKSWMTKDIQTLGILFSGTLRVALRPCRNVSTFAFSIFKRY